MHLCEDLVATLVEPSVSTGTLSRQISRKGRRVDAQAVRITHDGLEEMELKSQQHAHVLRFGRVEPRSRSDLVAELPSISAELGGIGETCPWRN